MILIFVISQYGYMSSENDSLIDSLKIRQEIMQVPKKISDQWFSQDKFLHFSACASIVGLSYHTLVCRLKKDEDTGKLYAFSLTAIIGLGKEFYDKKKKKYFSWKDLCWDGLGLTAGYFLFIHKY